MMHLAPMIHDLAIILGIAGLVSLLFQKIRQPVVLGYIIAGIIVGPYTPPFPLVTDTQGIKLWAELGVIFLMFSLGLEFSFRKLAKVGLTAGVTATVEVLFMSFLGFGAGKFLGYTSMDCLFLGAMLSISSTTIIIRALDELKLKTRRFAELIFAILVVEDLLAILVIVTLTTIALNKSLSSLVLLIAIAKLILVIGGWFIAGYFIIPRFMKYVGRVGTDEMLTLLSLGLCLILVVFASYFHYSVALGAFIMGSILAESTESHRIQERIAPLRDLFAAIFFVSIGMLLNPRVLWHNLGAVAILSFLTIAGKIVSTTIGSLATGQTLRNSIQVGFGLAQIGEFSFIIATLGTTLNVTNDSLYPIGVAVSIVTTFTTPYLIRISNTFAIYLEDHLPDRMKYTLSHYIVWMQSRKVDGAKKKIFYEQLLRWFLNGLIVSIIFITCSEFMIPFIIPILREKISSYKIADQIFTPTVGWFATVGISSPFIWAMLSVFKSYQGGVDQSVLTSFLRPGVLLIFRFLSLIWLGALSLNFFPIRYAISITGFFLVGFFGLFYRQIEASYAWFEKQFLSTFEKDQEDESQDDVLKGLAPWDARLVRIRVHPHAQLEMKSLMDSKLRNQFGINVIAIQRGSFMIVAPKPDEMILPQDELLVLGTDDQIEAVRPLIEKPPGFEDRSSPLDDYEVRQIQISGHSIFAGKTIRSSLIREKFNSMVVGIEEQGHRVVNPSPDVRLSSGDILWIVGRKEDLTRMMA